MGFHLKIGPVFLKHYNFLLSEFKTLKNDGWGKSLIAKIVNLSMILAIHHPETEILAINSPKIQNLVFWPEPCWKFVKIVRLESIRFVNKPLFTIRKAF